MTSFKTNQFQSLAIENQIDVDSTIFAQDQIVRNQSRALCTLCRGLKHVDVRIKVYSKPADTPPALKKKCCFDFKKIQFMRKTF